MKDTLLLKQRTESEYFPPPTIQLVRNRIIRCEGDDDRLLCMTGQLNVRFERGRSGALSEVMQGTVHRSGVVEDVVTVDVRGGALETLVGAPFEELVLVDRPTEVEDWG